MRIGLIGTGAISGHVQRHLAGIDGVALAGVLARTERPGAVSRLDDLPPVDLLVDCAGHGGLRAHGPAALGRGIDMVTLSLGALADADFAADLERAAAAGGARLHLASGAVGALDALRAAREGGLEQVRYIGRKPPQGWRGSAAEQVIDLSRPLSAPVAHFRGSAREAALRYPKNANIAAAIALAGCGFDATEVTLIADPDARGNLHRIEAEGAFGSFSFELAGASLPDNPRSSALAALSALSAIRQSRSPIGFL